MNIPTPPPHSPQGWPDWEAPMDLALDQARIAAANGEVPVGAVLLGPDGALLAQAHNAPITASDPTAHAEIRCLRAAAAAVGNYRLPGCVLIVTLEPCLMCVGALVHARVAGVVYGASDPKAGAIDSCLHLSALPFVNHRFWCISGIRAEPCGSMLSEFFAARRKRANTCKKAPGA